MRSRQSGLSLVEMMVAVLIGLIGILIISQVYITSDTFNRSTIGEGGAQTNGLIALYTIERDARVAGYGISDSIALGCGEVYWYYNPNYSHNINAGTPLAQIRLAPVYITTHGTAPDDLTVMYASDSDRMVPTTVKAFSKTTNLVTVDSYNATGFSLNDLVLLVNNTSGCTIGKVTFIDVSIPTTPKLQMNPSGSDPYNPAAWGSFPTSYALGDMVFNLGPAPVIRTYSISSSKLVVQDALLQAAGAAAVSLMDGIVDLRAQYGKDNGIDNGTVSSAVFAPNDGQVDQYSNAAPANGAEWAQVLSVRVGVLARIGDYEKPSPAGVCSSTVASPTWAGGNFTAIDVATTTSADRCYRYRVFETTVPLRNMIWRGS